MIKAYKSGRLIHKLDLSTKKLFFTVLFWLIGNTHYGNSISGPETEEHEVSVGAWKWRLGPALNG